MESTDEKQGSSMVPANSVQWRELIAVVLLSVTVILTAWTSFQASKWGGAMSIAFSQASAARIEAARDAGEANRQSTIQVGLFAQWVQAETQGNTEAAQFLAARFPEPLASSFTAWLATDPFGNPDAPATPFNMPGFVPQGLIDAEAADARADELFASALEYNQRGDNYTLLVVLFATVLFFAAMSGRVKRAVNSWLMLGLALVLFTGAVGFLASFPKLI